jgi:hypothetical protein
VDIKGAGENQELSENCGKICERVSILPVRILYPEVTPTANDTNELQVSPRNIVFSIAWDFVCINMCVF